MKNTKRTGITLIAILVVIGAIALFGQHIAAQRQHQAQQTSKAASQRSNSQKAASSSSKKAAIASAINDPNATAVASSTSQTLIQNTNYSDKLQQMLTTNKIDIRLQTILIKDETATVIFQDNQKQDDTQTYLNSYAKATAVALAATTNQTDKISTVRVARQLSLKNGSQFGVATLWTGDQLANHQQENIKDVTADHLLAQASRYALNGSIWDSLSQPQKNAYQSHITGGQNADNDDFNTWINNSTAKK
ncbi:hypothetical protein IV73_GL000041 [Weissella kandleri]|uniref:Uncharacterized protein n=1 Tax=Weissella kandleri TaxID=1616 RepID=A0A0R2JJV3_9LACO|nr:hypothetical protein [Weissella kandleri]KRN75557.1 hypothetical protein IV73_GL000041 [Weissella kandleri]